MTEDINNSICWIDGKWSHKNEPTIPICDRGVSLGDGIFETILIYQGVPKLLQNHINRMHKNASILNMDAPPSMKWIEPLIIDGMRYISLKNTNGRIRLNWSRGNNLYRGIEIPDEPEKRLKHRFWLEISSGEPVFESISTIISRNEKRNPYSKLSYCKTFNYGQAIQAKIEARLAGFDESLLLNTNNQICCGSTANLLVCRDNEWITPPLISGCMPGIMRQKAIDTGKVKEAEIGNNPKHGDQWLLINSLSCRPIYKLNEYTLPIFSKPEELWLSLIH